MLLPCLSKTASNGVCERSGEDWCKRRVTMNVRNLIASFILPRTRARLIKFEIYLKQSGISSKLASYLEPYLIKPYLARPHEIDIEVTSNCDADCIMCPRSAMRRKVGPMDFN